MQNTFGWSCGIIKDKLKKSDKVINPLEIFPCYGSQQENIKLE